MIQLSILICSIPSRAEMLLSLLSVLRPQIGAHHLETESDKDYEIVKYVGSLVEIIICTDNKILSVGAKRNLNVNAASGVRIVHVDDDDMVTDNHVSCILQNTHNDSDVIVFDAVYIKNGVFDRPVKYGIEFKKDFNRTNAYYRIPNHLMCVKREFALNVRFKDISFGEDSDYATRLLPLLKTQERINEVLYEYWFDDKLTETANKK